VIFWNKFILVTKPFRRFKNSPYLAQKAAADAEMRPKNLWAALDGSFNARRYTNFITLCPALFK